LPETTRPLDAHAGLGAALFAARAIAELTTRLGGSLGLAQTRAHQLLGSHAQVKIALLADVAAHVCASPQRKAEYTSDSSHCRSSRGFDGLEHGFGEALPGGHLGSKLLPSFRGERVELGAAG